MSSAFGPPGFLAYGVVTDASGSTSARSVSLVPLLLIPRRSAFLVNADMVLAFHARRARDVLGGRDGGARASAN